MKFEDLEVGMKVKVVSANGFYRKTVGQIGTIILLDPNSSLFDVKVAFDSKDESTEWGHSSALGLVEDEPVKALEQQLLDTLVKSMEEASNVLDLESLETLSKVYQRIKSVSNQTN